MATMRRVVNRAIFLGIALRSNSTAVCDGFTGGATVGHVDPYGTCSSSISQKLVDRLSLSNPYSAHSVRFGSSAATSLAQDVQSNASGRSEEGFKPKSVLLYQYEACPFCNKVKVFLDYYDIPYLVIEVHPRNKKEIEWSDYKKVPILIVDRQIMVDSSGIFSLTERFVAIFGGAAGMYFASKKLKKEHNITDERAALYEAAEQWVDALKGRKFLGGMDPNLADLAVFGVLQPIRHLKSGRDMIENTQIGKWYSDMEQAVGQSCRIININLSKC